MPRPSQIAAVKPAAAAKPAAPKASGSARFVQMGFFSVESNAKATLASLKANGISGQIVPGDSNGKKFWRVLAGPANSKSQQATLLQKVKSMGFGDAYLVKG
jgi:cell division protein FtsN